MLTIPASQLGYVSAVTALVMAITSGIGAVLSSLAFFKAHTQYFNWTVRAVNIVLMLVGVVIAEVTLKTFDLHNWLAYVSYALQGFTGAQLLYSAVTARIKNERDTAQSQLSAVVVPVNTNPNAGGLNSPVTFQPAGADHNAH